MDGYIVGSMISANSIVGEQIQANSIKVANLEVDVQKKIESATDEETVKTLIKADLDGFEVNVSNTYETKANVETKVNSIEIGGRNLAKQTKLLTNVGLNGWTVTDTGNEGFKKLEIVTTNTSWQECNIPLYTEINTITRKVTISFEYQETSSGLLMFSFGSYNGNTRVSEIANIAVSSSFKVISTNGNWKTVCYTFDPTSVNNKSGTTQYKIQFKKASGKTGTIYVRKPKIEFGTKATSWSPAPEDISADINTAKNDAITSANNTLSSTIANYYTKEQTDSQIKVAKDAITQSVSSTYETKTNVTTKLNNLSVSATNLMDNSAPLSTSGWLNWSSVSGLSTNMEVSTTDNSTHGKQGKITFSGSVTGNAGRHKLPVQKLTSGKTYSWSIWLRSGSGNLTVDVGQEQNGRREVSVGTSWTRFTHTYTANDNQYYAFIIRPKNVTSSHSLYFHSVMLVEGDKPVAWQTSPTEVLSDKTNIEQRMSSAESKITDEAITNTVKQNFYTKTETDNAITSQDYQTSSQVQQTVDALQLKFTQSGGYNLLRNSRPEKDSSLWIADSNATITVNFTDNCLKTSGWGNRFRITTTGTNTAGVRSHRFNVKPNTKYTISGWIYSDNTTNGAALYLRTSNTLTANGSPTDSAYDASLTIVRTASQSSYKFFSKTITTDANAQSAFVKMVHRGSTTSGTSTIVAFNQLQITEGELILPWSPNPSEVYDGITTIDKNGIKVSTNKGAYTQFDSNGMTSYDNSGNQTLGIRNGGMAFYASNNHEYVGYISQSFTSAKERNGVVVGLSHYGDYLALGVSDDTDPNQGFYKPSWILLSRYDDKSENVNYGINMYQDLYMHDCSLRNSNIKYDGFKRSSSDYISFNITNQTSSSQLNLELADDSSTYFNIRANNYSDGNKYIARFNYAKGTETSNIGVHFYRAINCHGYNITNVGNMSVYSLQSEDLEVNDIRITSPVAVASMNGRSTSTLSVVKSVDDITEAHGIVTISNKKEKVELPLGLMFTDYYVQVTGNKVANLAVTERTDEYFIIETDSEEEIEVFYTIKAFQPNYVTRTAVYGELQGEDGTCVETYEESMEEE